VHWAPVMNITKMNLARSSLFAFLTLAVGCGGSAPDSEVPQEKEGSVAPQAGGGGVETIKISGDYYIANQIFINACSSNGSATLTMYEKVSGHFVSQISNCGHQFVQQQGGIATFTKGGTALAFPSNVVVFDYTIVSSSGGTLEAIVPPFSP
jgi:hypothetical protein